MKSFRRYFVFLQLLLILSKAQLAFGQDAQPASSANQRILAQIKTHNELMSNVEYLSDMLGPRLTGSENLRNANLWTAQKFKAYGLENVHQEPWVLGRSWTRGTAWARIVAPAEHRIAIASEGWAAARRGQCAAQWSTCTRTNGKNSRLTRASSAVRS